MSTICSRRRGTLCIVTPSGDSDRYAPYFTTIVSAIIHAAETKAAAIEGPLRPRLLLALDEAGNVFRYPRLPHLLTTARGNGIQLFLVYHDLAQIEHLYGGREVARTVVSNAKMRMLLPASPTSTPSATGPTSSAEPAPRPTARPAVPTATEADPATNTPTTRPPPPPPTAPHRARPCCCTRTSHQRA